MFRKIDDNAPALDFGNKALAKNEHSDDPACALAGSIKPSENSKGTNTGNKKGTIPTTKSAITHVLRAIMVLRVNANSFIVIS